MCSKNLTALVCLLVVVPSLRAQQAEPQSGSQMQPALEAKCRTLLAFLYGCPVEDFASASFGPVRKETYVGGENESRTWAYDARILEARGCRCSVDEKGLVRRVDRGGVTFQEPCEGGVTQSSIAAVVQKVVGDSVELGKVPPRGRGRAQMWYRVVQGAWVESQYLTIVFDQATNRFSRLFNSIDPDKTPSVPTVKVPKERAEKQATKQVVRYLADRRRWKAEGLNPKDFKPVLENAEYALFLQDDGKLMHTFPFRFDYIGPRTEPVVPASLREEVRVDAVTGETHGGWRGEGGLPD